MGSLRALCTGLALLFLFVVGASGQSTKWELRLETEVYQPMLSPDGLHLVYFTDDDEVIATCVDVASGRKVWDRPLKDFEQYTIARFIGNDTILLGQEHRYEFVHVPDGKLLTSLPIVGDSWDDLVIEDTAPDEHDTIRPYFKNSIGIFYFDDGMQILDLPRASLIHQTEDVPGRIKYRFWEDFLLINPTSGADSIYIVDTRTGRLVYAGSQDESDINESIYQPFAVSSSEIILFNEDNTQSIDLETGRQNAIIEIDPDDPEFYTPIIFKNGLYLMVSDEGIQKLYSTKDGKLLWQTAEGAVPGVAEQLIELPNDEALLLAYELDGKMVTYKINASTGNVLWKRTMFVQDGELETGHKQGNKVWASVISFTYRVLASPGWIEPEYYDGFGYHPPRFSDVDNAAMIRRANELYNFWVNTEKRSEGYTSLLESSDTQVMFAVAGKIYDPGNREMRRYDGEAVVTLDLADGSVISSTPCEMLAKSESSDFNAYRDLKIQQLDSARALIGVHEIQILRGGNVQKFSFGEEVLSFINAGPNEITVVADDDGVTYDYWRIDAGSVPAKKYLLARSPYRHIVFHDSGTVTTMLKVDDENITAYPLSEGDVTEATFSSPKWTLTEDDLDRMDIGIPDEVTDDRDTLQGIRIIGDDVLLMGESAIGYVSGDGTCRWSVEWEPEREEMKMGVRKIGSAFVYSTGGVTAVLGSTCPPSSLGVYEIDLSDTKVLSHESGRVIVVNTDDGIIRGHNVQ